MGEYTIEKSDQDSPNCRRRIDINDALKSYQKSFTNLVTLNSPKASPIKSDQSSFKGNFEFQKSPKYKNKQVINMVSSREVIE